MRLACVVLGNSSRRHCCLPRLGIFLIPCMLCFFLGSFSSCSGAKIFTHRACLQLLLTWRSRGSVRCCSLTGTTCTKGPGCGVVTLRALRAQIFWNAFLSTLAHTGVDAPLLDTDEVRDALQQAADALPEPLHVQVTKSLQQG